MHAIVCVKIIAECKKEVLLEAVAIPEAEDRVFLFIHYVYISMTLEQKRENDQRSRLICAKLRSKSSRRGVFRSRVLWFCKNLEIFMACIFFSSFSWKA